MFRKVFVAALLVAVCVAGWATADYIRVTRHVTIKAEPSAGAEVVAVAEVGQLFRLLEDAQTNGYYYVQSYAGGRAGWVYRTFVRRYPGEPELAVVPAPPTPVPSGSEGPTAPLTEPSDASVFPIEGCPPEGSAVRASVKRMNPLKNRVHAPAPSQVHPINLEAILAPGDDHDRWSEDEGAEIVGWVKEVKPGGAETCNCRSPKRDDWDTHIELVKDPAETNPRRVVIVEVTPQWRRLMATVGKDWSTTTLKRTITGKQIRVRGWLFFDGEHEHQAENTEPDGDRNWRATAWEIHPITSLAVVSGEIH